MVSDHAPRGTGSGTKFGVRPAGGLVEGQEPAGEQGDELVLEALLQLRLAPPGRAAMPNLTSARLRAVRYSDSTACASSQETTLAVGAGRSGSEITFVSRMIT